MTLAPALFSTPMMERLPEKAKRQILKSAEFPVRFGHPDEFAQAVVTIIENSILVSLSWMSPLKMNRDANPASS